MGRFDCVECGRDTEGTLERCVLPYRCAECRDKIIARVEQVFGLRSHTYTEFSYELQWEDLKRLLDAMQYNIALRGYFLPDEARYEVSHG
jgi:hypothetical protein